MPWEERPEREAPLEIKERFATRYRTLLGEQYDTFLRCNLRYLRRAVRINTLKADVASVRARLEAAGWQLTPVPWCAEGFWIEGERLDIGNLLEHQLGYVYVQDPASMLPVAALQPQPHERILDMCASPGSKTGQAAAVMGNTGVIVANDVQGSRLAPLGVNLQRLGVLNAVFTKRDGRAFRNLTFERVLVDAPCSGTGTIRRVPRIIQTYNPRQVEGYARLQLQLAQAGFDALAPGGTMVYSTCTLEPLENEAVVSALLYANTDAVLEPINLPVRREEPFREHPVTGEPLRAEVRDVLRIHPYTNDTEGFFVAKIRKRK